MWRSAVGHNVEVKVSKEGDDWETDPDFENDVSEQEQRWGAKTIQGSGRKEHISVAELRKEVAVEHEQVKQKDQTPKASYGYGGKFGVEKDRMDKVALGNDYVASVDKHSSQKDASKGFGGKFGVEKDRVDKSALGFGYKGEVEQHTSQRDYSKGFGGKYGVEKEKVDKSALGYDYKGQTEKHQSQRDYSRGFGGKFGVEREKVDKAALGYDYKGETEKHQSQRDYTSGFGGRYGVQTDRMDKSAAGFSDMDAPTSSYEKTQPFEASSADAGKLKARFESMAKASGEENRRKAEEEKARRRARESRERELAERRQEEERSRGEDIPEDVPEDVPDAAPQFERPPPVVSQERENVEEGAESEVRNWGSVALCQGLLSDVDEPTFGSLAPLSGRKEAKEEPQYDEPPSLPPRSSDFLEAEAEADAPLLPNRSPQVDEEEEEDTGVYEDLGELAPPAPADVKALICQLSCGQRAKAIYDYVGEADDEISFNPEDIITHIEMIDEGWWRGECRGRTGLFPALYVQLL
uniref:Hematopoietic cell-specific Lyn substrate 1 n=1 Tax=Tetraodon nigroviridis TaxID=99883 RepID=H3D574_TETNG